MQLCRIIYYSLTALQVSSDIFAHHQEHLNFTYSFWFYSHVSLSAAVMDVSSDIFAHHQEHLNCTYSFWFYSHVSLSAAVMDVSSDIFSHHQEHLNCNYSFWFYSRVSFSERQRHTWKKPVAVNTVNPLNAELNPICHLLTLLGAHHILHISRIRVKMLLMMSENIARNM